MANLTADMPLVDIPLIDSNGNINEAWFMFFVQLFRRTGGGSTSIDITGLQKQVAAQGAEIEELFVAENSGAVSALFGALMARIAILEMTLQSTVPPMTARAPAVLPDPVILSMRSAAHLPEPVPVAARAPDDLRKLIEV